ncbi:unnamed protein product [Ceutorhynchus assimilis]|uniref:Protein sleepless n=1 Tax=Ceutorhynchus assimilis TaxID=467358 RepID=A0A9P0DJH0_9CUCU|nr:unnamed protein product [Ceutorhynchus assimilis]
MNCKTLLSATSFLVLLVECNSINCYQCSASDNMDCSDDMIYMGGIESKSCDHVFEAQYCIKSTSLDGGIGTKRYCSSLDLGNYCNYVKQPGDTLTYRSCVYTCTGDDCNSSVTHRAGFGVLGLAVLNSLMRRFS